VTFSRQYRTIACGLGKSVWLAATAFTTEANGTVEKAIFSITCTTCRARLVVRSEAAVGAILECPRCESMVQITPPAGWNPVVVPGEEAMPGVPSGPPPLDRVATGSQLLDLGPTDASLLDAVFGHLWLAGGTALATLLVVLYGLWWLLLTGPAESRTVAVEADGRAVVAVAKGSERPATAVAPETKQRPATAVTPETKQRPATAVAGGDAGQPPPPGPQSGGVDRTASSRPVEPKPAEPDLLPPMADEPGQRPPKDARPVELKKLPPPQVDVAARLADPLPGIELNDFPLAAAVDLLAAMSTTPITLSPEAIWQLGVTPQDPISLRLSSTTVGNALTAAAAQRGLAVVVDGGQVLVTTPPEYRELLRKVRYTVSDLSGDDKAAVAELASLVGKLVAPESWQAAGGRGSVEPDQGVLVVVQTGEVHQQVLVFCERLRNARQKPLRSRDKPERFTLATRADQARELLDRPVTVNFHEPAPLGRILAFLAEATGSTILVDRASLAAAETSDRVEATLTVQKQALGQALTELLRPLGLAYRASGHSLIQVTTPEGIDERLELEFYPIKPWLDRGISAQRLAEQLKGRVAPPTWSDVGGLAEICFDPPSGCLIVLQSQPAQAAIQRLLASPPQKPSL
jgi:hypothetical protein